MSEEASVTPDGELGDEARRQLELKIEVLRELSKSGHLDLVNIDVAKLIALIGPTAAAGAAIAKEAIKQRGETRREELRQSGETTRTALTGKQPEPRPVTEPSSEEKEKE